MSLKTASKTFFLAVIIIKIYFLLKTSLPPDIEVLQFFYFIFSLTRTSPALLPKLFLFAKEQGYLLFWFPTLLYSLIFSLTPPTLFLIKILNLLFLLGSAFFVTRLAPIFSKNIRLSPWFTLTFFFLAPWQNYLSTFTTTAALLTFLFTLFLYFLVTKSHISVSLLILIGFTNLTGLIFSLFYTATSRLNLKLKIIILFIITSAIFLNREFLTTSLRHSFLFSLSPQNLAAQINERQQTIFLASNQRFILPSWLRKTTSNKPLQAATLLLNHTIEFFDPEQFASPQSSYELIKLSRLSPKNPKLSLVWDIPLLLLGLFLFAHKANPKQKKLVLHLSLLAFLPYLFFEKAALPHSALLLSPLILLFELKALNQITQTSLTAFLTTFIFTLTFLNYYHSFLFHQPQYRYSHPMFYLEISDWLSQNQMLYPTTHLTTRFGPTYFATAFYSHTTPRTFWRNYPFSDTLQIDNLTFSPFQIDKDTPQNNQAYLGLIGEFVGPGKQLESHPLPPRLTIINKIKGSEEIVFNYGQELWIGEY